jgi:hypothetical protein
MVKTSAQAGTAALSSAALKATAAPRCLNIVICVILKPICSRP